MSKIIHRADQIKVIFYHWVESVPDETSEIFGFLNNFNPSGFRKSIGYDISDHVISFSYTKNMSDAAGGFSITLDPSKDWADLLRPGSWISVYLSSNGDLDAVKPQRTDTVLSGTPVKLPKFPTLKTPDFNLSRPELPLKKSPANLNALSKYLRCLGFIQRVAINRTTGTNGEQEITYTVSGKDFGIVLEETELWFNMIAAVGKSVFQDLATSKISATPDSRKLTNILSTLTDGFLVPSKIIRNPLVKLFDQWLMPDQLLKDLGISISTGKGYFGEIPNLKQYANTTFENNMPNPAAALEGTAWEKLKQISQPEFHELFTELNDSGQPRIYFRPIPWGIDQSGYPTLAQTIDKYVDLAEEKSSVLELLGQLASTDIDSLISGVSTNFSLEDRKKSTSLASDEIISIDVGPEFHTHSNLFLVEPVTAGDVMATALSLFSKKLKALGKPYPFRNEQSIKRYGLKPKIVQVQAYKSDFKGFLTKKKDGLNANEEFIRQLNEVLLDYWGHQAEYYSGTFNILGKNDIRIGRALRTKSDVHGIPDMLFYIEGYSDSFTVDPNGTGLWTQSIQVTHGLEIDDLKTKKIRKDSKNPKTASFVKKGK